MIARPQDIDPVPSGSGSQFARSVLNIAAEVEAAENEIKNEILRAARVGDTAAVITIVTRWQTLPATEVLAEGSSCGKTPVLPPHALIEGARSR